LPTLRSLHSQNENSIDILLQLLKDCISEHCAVHVDNYRSDKDFCTFCRFTNHHTFTLTCMRPINDTLHGLAMCCEQIVHL